MTRIVTLPPNDSPEPDGAKTAGWWQAGDEGHVQCTLCPRNCHIAPGKRGFCFVRENRGGRLVSTTYGRSTGFCVDPIEKKPLFQFHPGTSVLSFGTAGCNLGCRFCQNWTISHSRSVASASELAQPETVAHAAQELGCRSVALTYNDPVIWAEYAIDTAKACRAAGVKTVAVTAGYIAKPARAEFFRYVDAANVDLKAFREAFYRNHCSGHLAPVLDTLRYLVHETEVWIEITNLVIPEENDSPEELKQMCQWIAGELGTDVPIHFTAFHPDFQATDRGPTPRETLTMAHRIARRSGLHYVYTGNVDDPDHQATLCPNCGQVVIGRHGYTVSPYRIDNGRCSDCGARIAGRYSTKAGDWRGRRLPVRIADYAILPSQREVKPAFIAVHRPEFPAEQQQRILQAAGRRVRAAVLHTECEPARQTLPAIAQTPLYGAFVSLKRDGKLRSCCGCLGDAIPLWKALDRAAARAACDDPRFPPIANDELDQLDLEVWLLWHPEPVHERGAARTRAVEIGRHGVQISRGAARGLLLPGVAVEHGLNAEGFLRQVCLKAGLPLDAWQQDDTSIMTFEGDVIRGKLALPDGKVRPNQVDVAVGSQAEDQGLPSSANRPVNIRPPAVAGKYYPATPGEIDAMLDAMIPKGVESKDWAAAMVPHAGWIYSGHLAAATLARVNIPQQVIVVCPRHTGRGAEWAAAPYQAWSLPGGRIAADPELAALLVDAVPGLELDAVAHREEHAIEVQLPLIARLRPDARVLGLAIGGGRSLAELQQFGQQLAGVMRSLDRRPLLIISTDMNHFADDRQTRALDRTALDAVRSLDPACLYRTVHDNAISMCGVLPAVIAMEALRTLGLLRRVEEVAYATSADAGGSTERVVGYAGLLMGR